MNMLGQWERRRRHLLRYQSVVNVLVRHGFLYVVDSLGLGGWVTAARRLGHGLETGLDSGWAERLALALTDMGTTFVKLGQLASTRTDILPDNVIKALEQLQDAVPPFDFTVAMGILEKAWEQDPRAIAPEIDPVPIAAASIGQVHAGRLADGSEVVIKIRRPGMIEQSRTDFEILQDLAELAERRTPWGREYGVVAMVEELIRAMEDEMDFNIEGRHTELARRHLATDPRVLVPRVHWQWTRPDVLVMSRLAGTKIVDADGIRELGLSPEDLARHLVHVMYQQIFIDGFFHADPHPGNVHIGPAGELIFLDWGMVGQLSPAMRERSVDLLVGMIRGRSETVVDALLRLGIVSQNMERKNLEREVERLRRQYYETTLEQFHLGRALTDLFAVANRYHVRIPSEYAILAKTAVTLDGLVRRLNPKGSLIEYGKPFAARLFWSRWGPEHVRDALWDNARQWIHVLGEMPQGLDRLMERIDRGEIHIILEHKNLDHVLDHWEKLINRVGMSLLLGALIVGSGLVVHRDSLDHITALPFGEYVFLAAAAMALWVIIGAIRRGRL